MLALMPAHAAVHVGTSGWSYAHWKDDFYEGVPQRAWLEAYADRFDTVEVNGSFYSLPKDTTIDKWADKTPHDFRFTMKMWRGVTHYRKLKEARDLLVRFFDPVAHLPKRERGPILVQLPPNMGKNVERLKTFLDEVKDLTAPDRWKIAVEFRDDSWNDKETRKVLDDERAAMVVHDMTGVGANDEPNDASFVYVRRHGPHGDMSKGYSDSQLEADKRRIEAWREEGRTVYVYYNNDVKGDAPRDAGWLKDHLQA